MSDNNSGEKKMVSSKEMRSRIETVLAFLNQNLRGKEEPISLALLSAVAGQNIILSGRSNDDKEWIRSCIDHAFQNRDPLYSSMEFSSEAYPESKENWALTVEVKPIADDNDFFHFVNTPFDTIQNPTKEQKAALLTEDEVFEWQELIDQVELSEEAKKIISEIRRKCFDYYVSDTRWRRIIYVLKTCAFLNGRSKVDLIDSLLIDYAIPNNFVEEILKRYAVESKLDSRQHAQYKANIFTRHKYYGILKASIDDTKLKLEHKDELY